jgi:hypothetical protein
VESSIAKRIGERDTDRLQAFGQIHGPGRADCIFQRCRAAGHARADCPAQVAAAAGLIDRLGCVLEQLVELGRQATGLVDALLSRELGAGLSGGLLKVGLDPGACRSGPAFGGHHAVDDLQCAIQISRSASRRLSCAAERTVS